MEGHNPSFGYNIEAGLLAADIPVDSVTWEEAKEYCRRLNLREMKAGRVPPGYEYRLPTEADWEYVVRANTSGAFSFEIRILLMYLANTAGGGLTLARRPCRWVNSNQTLGDCMTYTVMCLNGALMITMHMRKMDGLLFLVRITR